MRGTKSLDKHFLLIYTFSTNNRRGLLMISTWLNLINIKKMIFNTLLERLIGTCIVLSVFFYYLSKRNNFVDATYSYNVHYLNKDFIIGYGKIPLILFGLLFMLSILFCCLNYHNEISGSFYKIFRKINNLVLLNIYSALSLFSAFYISYTGLLLFQAFHPYKYNPAHTIYEYIFLSTLAILLMELICLAIKALVVLPYSKAKYLTSESSQMNDYQI